MAAAETAKRQHPLERMAWTVLPFALRGSCEACREAAAMADLLGCLGIDLAVAWDPVDGGF